MGLIKGPYPKVFGPAFSLWRTLVASDPFIDLSLTSISQLALAERHADGFQNLAGGGGREKKTFRNAGGGLWVHNGEVPSVFTIP